MKCYSIFLLTLVLYFSIPQAIVYGQHWRLHINGNETFFTGNGLLGQYPILGYSGKNDRGVLVGGFGGGMSYTTVQKDIFQLKYQFNFQRARFYDLPVIFTDLNGESLGAFIGINTNLNTSLMATPQLLLGEHFLAGIGLGGRYLFRSSTDFGEAFVNGEKVKLKEKNQAMAPVELFVPVEVTGLFGRFSVTTRMEGALTNFFSLDAYQGNRALRICLEFAYELSDPDRSRDRSD